MDAKNCFVILLILLAVGIFSSGCAGYAQNVKDKCPDCGTIYIPYVANVPAGY
jgi:hypothetical protein